MSRAFSFLGIAGAGIFGVLIARAAWQPEFEALRAERLGEPKERTPQNDKVISEAIMSDLKEAKEQVTGVEKGGFAWGIRQMIWGKAQETAAKSSSVGEPTSARSEVQDNEGGKD